MPLRRSTLAAGAAVTLALSGCPSPAIYGTARTLPVGTIQHTAAIETIGVFPRSSESTFVPTLPTYQLRVGVHERVELGFRVANLSSIGFDAKVNVVRGAFDLALVPGVQGMYIGLLGSSSRSTNGLGIVYFNLPIVLGFNISRSFSLIATPGATYVLATTSDTSGATYNAAGFAARLGAGANIRVSSSFSISPEVTALYFPESEGVLFTGGVGLSFGGHPEYDDL